jgi:Ubiquitin-protein ligase
MNGVSKFNIHRDYGHKDRLPSSHTCFNRKFFPAFLGCIDAFLLTILKQSLIFLSMKVMKISVNAFTRP